MPKEFFIVLMVCATFFPFALWGMWDSFLKHRRALAELADQNQVVRLSADKAELKETVAMLEDRLSVLETIATDPARRTADEIENLR